MLHALSENSDGIEKTLEKLCTFYNQERLKGTSDIKILNQIEQLVITEQKKPEDIINWFLNNQHYYYVTQHNHIIQCILSDCYFNGKWVSEDK
ncbi:5899_t:CDS:2, partial [Scutellospora calospora]